MQRVHRSVKVTKHGTIPYVMYGFLLVRYSTGYADVHVGLGYEIRTADGSRILEFADNLGLVICNTCFMKQDSKLVS